MLEQNVFFTTGFRKILYQYNGGVTMVTVQEKGEENTYYCARYIFTITKHIMTMLINRF